MTRQEFIEGLRALGEVECRPHPSGQQLVVLAAQPVPGTGRASRVAFLLPDPVTGRPQTFVDADLRTRSNGLPNNWTTAVINTDVFGTWSFNCAWDGTTDSAEALVMAVLAQWDR